MKVYYTVESKNRKKGKYPSYLMACEDFKIRSSKNDTDIRLVENVQYFKGLKYKTEHIEIKNSMNEQRRIGFSID